MVFIRWKVKGKKKKRYAYLVRNVRTDGKVKQQILSYLGRWPVLSQQVLSSHARPSGGTTINKKKLEDSFNREFSDVKKWTEKKIYSNLKKLREERELSMQEFAEYCGIDDFKYVDLERFSDDREKAETRALSTMRLCISLGSSYSGLTVASVDTFWKANKRNIISFLKRTADLVSLCKVVSPIEKEKISVAAAERRAPQQIDYSKISDKELWSKLKTLKEFYKLDFYKLKDGLYNNGKWVSHSTRHLQKLLGRSAEKDYDKEGMILVKKKYKYAWLRKYPLDDKKFIGSCRKYFRALQREFSKHEK